MAEVASDLAASLACPVCLELPAGEVHQCFEGHCYCVDCWRRLDPRRCPECRDPIPLRNRSRAQEARVAALPAVCRTTATIPQRAVGWRSTCAPASSGPPPAQAEQREIAERESQSSEFSETILRLPIIRSFVRSFYASLRLYACERLYKVLLL